MKSKIVKEAFDNIDPKKAILINRSDKFEILSQYLPHKVFFKDIVPGYIQPRELTIHSLQWCLDNGELILRPLKDMYEIEEIMDEFSEYGLENFERRFFGVLSYSMVNKLDHVSYTIVKLMCKYHLDIFELYV